MKRSWKLESLGILKEEHSVHQKFAQQITFKKGWYEVHLQWKVSHPHLPDNYNLCRKQLSGLQKRLRCNPKELREYDPVIQDQLSQGIVETIEEPAKYKTVRTHYLLHQRVVQQDKQTTKLRVVYSASAKTDGPSLNDCLYTSPDFGQNILDILLRFQLHQFALVRDVETHHDTISDMTAEAFIWCFKHFTARRGGRMWLTGIV